MVPEYAKSSHCPVWVFVLDFLGVLGQGLTQHSLWHLVPYDHPPYWGKDFLISNKTGPDATKQLNKSCAHLVQEYWRGLSFLSPGDLPDPGSKPVCPTVTGGFLPLSHQGNPMSTD